MTATIISIDRRSEQVVVTRAALSAAAENSLAASQNASDALERAIGHVWSGNRAAIVHELGRVGFELQGRMAALRNLTNLAETATACPDAIAAPSHGRAA